jgi:hypothetical protein
MTGAYRVHAAASHDLQSRSLGDLVIVNVYRISFQLKRALHTLK